MSSMCILMVESYLATSWTSLREFCSKIYYSSPDFFCGSFFYVYPPESLPYIRAIQLLSYEGQIIEIENEGICLSNIQNRAVS